MWYFAHDAPPIRFRSVEYFVEDSSPVFKYGCNYAGYVREGFQQQDINQKQRSTPELTTQQNRVNYARAWLYAPQDIFMRMSIYWTCT